MRPVAKAGAPRRRCRHGHVRRRRLPAPPHPGRGLRPAPEGAARRRWCASHGHLARSRSQEPLSRDDTERALRHMLTATRRSSTSSTGRARSTSPTRSPGLARFRVNAFRQRGSISLVCRAIPFTHPLGRGAQPAAGDPRARRGGARHRAAHRHHRLGQVDDARGDDRPHQPDARASTSSRSRTRSSTCTATRRSIINQREVGLDTAVLQARPAPRAAPGPRRHPHRRDARRGDGAHRAVGGRDRPPRALHGPHRGRDRVDQPHARLLPAPPAAAGARDDRRHAEGRRLPAPGAHRRRRRPRGRLRDPAHDRPRART